MNTNKDQIYRASKAAAPAKPGSFVFDARVASVFTDMISRSVPGYDLLLRMIGLYANVFVQDNSRVYDLGCSLGDVACIVANKTVADNISIVAVDNSPSMIEECRQLEVTEPAIDWQCDDIENIGIDNASMVVLNLTLLFFDKNQRQALLERIYKAFKADTFPML